MTHIITARIAAILSAVSVVVHLLALTQMGGGGMGLWMMATMAAACLLCTWRLWRGASIRCWIETLGMYGAMLAIHHLFPLPPSMHVGVDHHHGASAASVIDFHEMSLVVMWMMAALASVCLAVAVSRRLLSPAIPHTVPATLPVREKA